MSNIEGTGGAEDRYWKANLRWLVVILGTWFFVSFGCGILFRDWFDENFFKVGTAPFGFWMAQQGSIISFILLLIAYAKIMNGLDEKYEVEGESK